MSERMHVLVIGGGGREHALAWKLAQSPRLGRLSIAPGNAGTAALGENVPLAAEGPAAHAALVKFCQEQQVDLVVVGPEAPLAAGLADALRAADVPTFGPSAAAAQIEASKVFAKDFMRRHAIPTARYATFKELAAARVYLRGLDYPVVIKASGLAAGKGVLLPETLEQAEADLEHMLLGGEFGAAGEEVVIEERLSGPEISLLAFTDGRTVQGMPPAQDHKRLLAGDRGPNTGGMGAFAPSPLCPPELADTYTRTFLQAAVDGLRQEGRPFNGVLYAGLMLTPHGPRLLEFNCRFGDPETQALLPLLDSDLLEISLACALGRLDQVQVRWKPGAAACVVLASEGYPGKYPSGRPVRGLERPLEQGVVFHAGTRQVGGQVLTAGGRVLGVTGWDATLEGALARAYQAVEGIEFEGMQYRRDIGGSPPSVDIRLSASPSVVSSYASAGVDIDAGNRAVELMKAAVQATYTPAVLAGIGAFGGLYDAAALQAMSHPVLVASTDGVGTKVKLAAQAGSYHSIGHDIVNHCINDILVQGARPLFFLDYIASSRLEPQSVAEAVSGMAQACQSAGCALLGGETAEMPGVYTEGAFDVAGTILGVVERRQMLPRSDLSAGDLLVGLASSGPHTNGYSLIRTVFAGLPLETVFPELGVPLGQALLAPHRSYLGVLGPLLAKEDSPVKALVHLTGGSFIENIPRILPAGLGACVRRGSWPVLPIFTLIQTRGDISDVEMHRVFNMGLGMLAVVAPERLAGFQAALPEACYVVGELVAGQGVELL